MKVKNKFDILAIGDSTIDLFAQLPERTLTLKKGKKEYLLIPLGKKIPLDFERKIFAAGNASNFAIAVSKLGLKCAIYTTLGKDIFGKEMEKVLKSYGVNTDLVVFQEEQGINVVLSFKGERTILTYHPTFKYSLPDLSLANWVYYTSLGKEHEFFHQELPKAVSISQVKLVFNPGSYQIREGLTALKPILEVCELLILNKEEAQTLVGEKAIKDLLFELKQIGPKMVVITDGKNGSFATDGFKYYYLKALNLKPSDTTGAGDAFSAGLVSALVYGLDLKEALVWGTVEAGSVISRVGSHSGTLTKSALLERIKIYKDLIPQEI